MIGRGKNKVRTFVGYFFDRHILGISFNFILEWEVK